MYRATLFYGGRLRIYHDDPQHAYAAEYSEHDTLRRAKAWIRLRLRAESPRERRRLWAYVDEGPERTPICVADLQSGGLIWHKVQLLGT
jgi:hypothetical protein